MKIRIFLTIAFMLLSITGALAQTTAFTYQGKLTDNGSPANGNYDLTLALFDTAGVGTGTQQGTTLNLTNVAVSGGVFTAQLDFGACGSCFSGASRFLEIAVRPSGGGSFTTLSPRQPLSSTPYAVRSLSAATADTATNATNAANETNATNATNATTATTATNAQQLGGFPASQYVLTVDARLSHSRTPTAGSASYIQNRTSQ